MKLKHQIIALGLVGILSSGLVGGIGLLQTARLSAAIDDSEAMSSALQNSPIVWLEAPGSHVGGRELLVKGVAGAPLIDLPPQPLQARQGPRHKGWA